MAANNEVKEFYAQDIVYRFNKHRKIVIGSVIDSYEYSYNYDNSGLRKGQIRVMWLDNSREEIWNQDKVKLLSRLVTPGQIVRRLEQGKETQRGYCRSVKQTATVRLAQTDKIIEHVPQERFTKINPLDLDAAVCKDKNFGRVELYDVKVTLKSRCGSIVEIYQNDLHPIHDPWIEKYKYSRHVYTTGLEIRTIPSGLKQGNWIKKTKTMKRNFNNLRRFVVEKTEVVDVEVLWYVSEVGEKTTDIINDDISMLKFLENVDDTLLTVGEPRLLKLNSNDVLIKQRDWLVKQALLRHPETKKMVKNVIICKPRNYRSLMNKLEKITPSVKKIEEDEGEDGWCTESEDEDSLNGSASSSSMPPKLSECKSGHTVPVEILCNNSKATIIWQDGTEEKDVPTTQLYYSISLDDHEFFPGEWVITNAKNDKEKYGVVQKVDYLERIATIKWFTYDSDKRTEVFDCVNDMSVYDLTKHSKFTFRPGSQVLRCPLQDNQMGTVVDSYPEGYIVVKWLDGTVEQCSPHNIEILAESKEGDSSDYEEDDDVSVDISWETESIESISCDLAYEVTLQNMAARLDFVRSRIIYIKEAFSLHKITENFMFLKNLLMIYENSSYLDKLLDTSFFSPKSRHYQVLLQQVKDKAKQHGVEIRGRLFATECQSNKAKAAERENINKVIKMEQKVHAQIKNAADKESNEGGEPSTSFTSEKEKEKDKDDKFMSLSEMDLCIELLLMLKSRMDLAYAEIIARLGGLQVFSVKKSPYLPPIPAITPGPVYDDPLHTEFKFPVTTTPLTPTYEIQPFSVLDEAPETHWYFSKKIEPTNMQRFFKAVEKESKLLCDSLPPGVWVKSFTNRLDLLSVMIRGPHKTPYEDGLFLFDIQLSVDYPRSPPLVSYISYINERLNPNLYVEGRVCVSLLGTWLGRGTEVWGPNSTLLQLIVSIQGLILVAEPYYNEAGYEKQTESQQGYENSRTYNELVVLKLVKSMNELLASPPEIFKEEIKVHLTQNGYKLYHRLKALVNNPDPPKPDFPLLPISKGLKLSLNNELDNFYKNLEDVINRKSATWSG